MEGQGRSWKVVSHHWFTGNVFQNSEPKSAKSFFSHILSTHNFIYEYRSLRNINDNTSDTDMVIQWLRTITQSYPHNYPAATPYE